MKKSKKHDQIFRENKFVKLYAAENERRINKQKKIELIEKNLNNHILKNDGSINSPLVSYQFNPTIKSYIHIRRNHPSENLSFQIFDATDIGHGRLEISEFEKFGFSLELIENVIWGDIDAINELSLQILEKIVLRSDINASGTTHAVSRGLTLSDTLIDYAVVIMLEAIEHVGIPLSLTQDFAMLLRERSGGLQSDFSKRMIAKQGKSIALRIAVALLMAEVSVTTRSVGEAMNVSHSTINRWFRGEDILELAKAEVVKSGYVFSLKSTLPPQRSDG